MLNTVSEHDRVVSSTKKNFRARAAVECSNIFLSAGNNPGVLKNSTEHAETLFTAFRQFPQVNSIQLTNVLGLAQSTRRWPLIQSQTGHTSASGHLAC